MESWPDFDYSNSDHSVLLGAVTNKKWLSLTKCHWSSQYEKNLHRIFLKRENNRMIISPEKESSQWDINPEMMFRLFEVFAWHRNTTHLFRVGKPQRMGMFGQLLPPRWGIKGDNQQWKNWTETVTLWQPGIHWNPLDVTRATIDPSLLTLVVPISSTNEKHPLLETHIWLSVGKIPICVILCPWSHSCWF